MRDFIIRYMIFIVGLYSLSFGIVFIVCSTLGTTPISSVNYVLSLNTPFSLGICTFLVNSALIFGQFCLVGLRKDSRKDIAEILLQFPFSFLFSAFIDVNMSIMSSFPPDGYLECVILLVAGCLSQSVGVALELKANVAIMSAEGFVKYYARRFGKDFGKSKVLFDITLVACAAIISLALKDKIEGIREGTLVAALSTGFIVSYLSSRLMTRRNLSYLIFPFRHHA